MAELRRPEHDAVQNRKKNKAYHSAGLAAAILTILTMAVAAAIGIAIGIGVESEFEI